MYLGAFTFLFHYFWKALYSICDGQTDRHDEADSRLSQFSESSRWALGPSRLPFNGYRGKFPPDLSRRSVKFNISFSTEVKNQWKHTSIPKQGTTRTTL